MVKNNASSDFLHADLTSVQWSSDKQKNQEFLLELQNAMTVNFLHISTFFQDFRFNVSFDEYGGTLNWSLNYDIGYYASASLWNKAFNSDFIPPKYNVTDTQYNGTLTPYLMWTEITGHEVFID